MTDSSSNSGVDDVAGSDGAPAPKTDSPNLDDNSEPFRIEEEQIAIDKAVLLLNKQQFYVGIAFNAILAISTAILAVVTWQLFVATDALRISSADQARPYVFLTKISKTSKDNEPYVVVKNEGQTPAFDVQIAGEGYIQPPNDVGINVRPNFDRSCAVDTSVMQKLRLNPIAHFNLGTGEERQEFLATIDTPPLSGDWAVKPIDHFTSEQLAALESGKSAYIIVGVVCYRDLQKRIYYTRYCRMFGNIFKSGGGAISTRYLHEEGVDCTAHNDAG